MCVIILRNPGVSIPFEKLQSACIVNPDGWGIAVADRGKLTITKGLNAKATDPEVIAKLLEDAKNQALMLHLRYVTSGERTLENCHPWTFLEHSKHGIDAAFCHNGTLYQWKETDSKRPDSWHINEKLVKPLYERVVAYAGPKDFLRDEFAIELLEQTAGTTSLFGLIDGNGTQLAINHANGTNHEGWWSSNDYSFNRTHREPVVSTPLNSAPWYDDQSSKYYQSWEEIPTEAPAQDNAKPETEEKDEEDGFVFADEEEMEEMEELLEQCEKIKETLTAMTTTRLNPKLIKACLSQTRPTFTELCKISDLREITRFDPEDLCELAVFYPEATAVLLQDLLAELYLKGLKQRPEQAQAA